MYNTKKQLNQTLQLLLETGTVNEMFVEDVRDALLLVDDDMDVPELFEGTLKALDELDIDVKKMRMGEYNKQ